MLYADLKFKFWKNEEYYLDSINIHANYVVFTYTSSSIVFYIQNTYDNHLEPLSRY